MLQQSHGCAWSASAAQMLPPQVCYQVCRETVCVLHLTLWAWLLPGWQLQRSGNPLSARLCRVCALHLRCTLLWPVQRLQGRKASPRLTCSAQTALLAARLPRGGAGITMPLLKSLSLFCGCSIEFDMALQWRLHLRKFAAAKKQLQESHIRELVAILVEWQQVGLQPSSSGMLESTVLQLMLAQLSGIFNVTQS